MVSHHAPGHAWQRMTQHKHHLHQWCGIQTTSSVTFDSTCEGPSSLTQRSQPSTRTAPFSLGTTSRSCCVHHKIACLVGFGWVAWRDLTPGQNYEITKIQATKKQCWKVTKNENEIFLQSQNISKEIVPDAKFEMEFTFFTEPVLWGDNMDWINFYLT